MLLSEIAKQSQTVPLTEIPRHAGLAAEMQTRLGELGILDPPADGQFGPVSAWAFSAFAGGPAGGVTPELAGRLLEADAGEVRVDGELAGRLITAVTRLGHWVARAPGCVNIVYVEGMGPDGKVNDNKPNQFNDARFALRVEADGLIRMAGAWEATTEPGKKFTDNPENPAGAARIAFGQHKAWSVGNHKRDPNHEALVQVAPLPVFRDGNRDYRRDGDRSFTGLFGINQHHGWNYGRENIVDASAGCLVGRLKTGHQEFMKIVKGDPRYGASRGYRFMTVVMPAGEVG